MLKLIAGIMAGAFAFAGWRNMPRLPHPQSAAAGTAIAACILAAYWLGKRRSRESALAIATARAEATAMASVTSDNRSHAAVFVNLDPNLGAARAGAAMGLANAPWLVDANVDQAQLVEAETDYAESVLSEFATEDVER